MRRAAVVLLPNVASAIDSALDDQRVVDLVRMDGYTTHDAVSARLWLTTRACHAGVHEACGGRSHFGTIDIGPCPCRCHAGADT